jgi:hypothetical protein
MAKTKRFTAGRYSMAAAIRLKVVWSIVLCKVRKISYKTKGAAMGG